MPQLKDDAIYLSGIEAQFTGTPVNGQVSVKWSFVVSASENFNNYDPSSGLVPGNFVLNGAAFVLSSNSPTFTSVNISGTSGSGVSTGLKFSGSETTGTLQNIDLSAVYTRVR